MVPDMSALGTEELENSERLLKNDKQFQRIYISSDSNNTNIFSNSFNETFGNNSPQTLKFRGTF